MLPGNLEKIMISNEEASRLLREGKYVELMNSISHQWGDKMAELIPERMHECVARWVGFGQRDYELIDRIAANDLFGAFREADDDNKERLADYVKFFYMYTPSPCHHSQANNWKGVWAYTMEAVAC